MFSHPKQIQIWKLSNYKVIINSFKNSDYASLYTSIFTKMKYFRI